MIQQLVDRYMSRQEELRIALSWKHPEDYLELVKIVIGLVTEQEYEENPIDHYPDPDRITQIDHGSYQGTLVFVIGEIGYQPSIHYATKVEYGSCSVCDTFQGIQKIHLYEYADDVIPAPNEGQIKDYMTLCLHLIQKLKII